MIMNIIYGVIVGIAIIIPGISGGTALVFLGLYNKTMNSISSLAKMKNMKDKIDDIIFLFQMGIGLIIGLIWFAKVIEYLLNYYPTQTMYWFIGLIIFSIPTIVKKELKKEEFSKFYFVMGLIIIGIIFCFSKNLDLSTTDFKSFPVVDIHHLIAMVLYGIIGGFVTIIPGASGSMILLILGQYQLIQFYLAHITSLQYNVIAPLIFLAIGAVIGVILGAKIVTYCMSKYKAYSMSVILGLVIMSAIVLIPTNTTYNLSTIISSIAAFVFGGLIIITSEQYKNKKVHK